MEEYISRKYLEGIVDYYLAHSNGAEHYAYGIIRGEVRIAPSTNNVPVDEIRLHHILVDENGVPEVKLQFGETFVLLRGDRVDVREVVHGHWVLADDGDGDVCSVCGTDFCNIIYKTGNWNYCPSCGARMDA